MVLLPIIFPYNSFPDIQKSEGTNEHMNTPDIITVNILYRDFHTEENWTFLENDLSLIIGFLSPDLDFRTLSHELSERCGGTPLILSSTAGELCNNSFGKKLPLYHSSQENRGNIVLMCFSSSVISEVDIHTIDLSEPDMNPAKRVEKIEEELDNFHPSFPLRSENCVAYTIIDGLSRGESFFMEAAYNSGKLPCLIIGGSAGGKLDFRNTWIYNNQETVQNKAVITLIRLRDDIKLGVFKSQNFKMTDYSITVAQANPAMRTIKSVFLNDTGEIYDVISELCRHFQCSEKDLEKKLTNYSFALTIDNDIYVRSISGIDYESREISFYCDLDFGDELFIVENTDFISSVERDYEQFKNRKGGKLLGGLFNDCILRRLFNQDHLAGVKCFNDIPVAGFSTFGELLGVNINQTLTALMFYRVTPDTEFHDEYLDNYIQKYSAFKEFFLKRKLNQMNQMMKMKDRVWNGSMKSIELLSGVIETSSLKAAENEKLLSSINNNFTDLIHNIDESGQKGHMIEEELLEFGINTERIEEILLDIVDIAGQINILGFNASIEAARAGLAGKGFAIIAREVKTLSDKTDTSANDSKNSLKGLMESLDLLRGRSDNIIKSQNEAKEQSLSLKEDIYLLAENSRAIERSISDNVSEIQQLRKNLNQMKDVIELLL